MQNEIEKVISLIFNDFYSFPNILGRNRVKIPEFGGHRIEFGGACIVWTQDSRRNIFFTWIMNKSVYKRFIDEIRPLSILTGHKKPSLEIWFETDHFEILSFRARAQISACSLLKLEMILKTNSHGFFKFVKLVWNPLGEMNKT